jgi:hypothetical protein
MKLHGHRRVRIITRRVSEAHHAPSLANASGYLEAPPGPAPWGILGICVFNPVLCESMTGVVCAKCNHLLLLGEL